MKPSEMVVGSVKKLPEWQVWVDIRKRCRYRNGYAWPWYGGRGICVCEKWNSSFAAFLDDVGHRPSPDHTLDRIDNDGNYEPGNVRWATMKEQSNNRRSTKMLTHNGMTMSIAAWADRLGLPRPTLYNRIRVGMPLVRALVSGRLS